MRGYFARSSASPNCVGFTKIETTTAAPARPDTPETAAASAPAYSSARRIGGGAIGGGSSYGGGGEIGGSTPASPRGQAASRSDSLGEAFAKSFARQIGTGEAVEYAEAFELLRAVAHAAYAAGATDPTGGPLTCAECGDQDATGYVVTILDTADPKHTRTEARTRCHE